MTLMKVAAAQTTIFALRRLRDASNRRDLEQDLGKDLDKDFDKDPDPGQDPGQDHHRRSVERWFSIFITAMALICLANCARQMMITKIFRGGVRSHMTVKVQMRVIVIHIRLVDPDSSAQSRSRRRRYRSRYVDISRQVTGRTDVSRRRSHRRQRYPLSSSDEDDSRRYHDRYAQRRYDPSLSSLGRKSVAKRTVSGHSIPSKR